MTTLASWLPHNRSAPSTRRLACGVVAWFVMLSVAMPAAERPAATVRAEHYEDAVERARASGNDIVVLQRGSDWNRLGETLYQTIWSQPQFVRDLGDGFVLVTVDRPEVVGDPPVPPVAQPLGNRTSTRSEATVAEAQRIAQKNQTFSWWDTSICPRIAFLDSQGRAIASDNKPRLGLTSASLAKRIKEFRSLRQQRDALWAEAERAQGPARAELLRQGLDLLGFANWTGNGKCYLPIHQQIRAADPDDASGASRWLTFGPDPRDGFTWAEPRWSQALDKKTLTDADFQEAMRRIDRDLQDPRNRVLNHERRQRIMIAKYLVYSRWPNHQDQRFAVQQEIAALDPDTFWGIGARGELAMHHRSAVPMITYGWGPGQIRAGLNTWDLTDTAYVFDHAGRYTVRMIFKSGQDAFQIRRIALLEGKTVVSQATPAARLGPEQVIVEAELDLTAWHPERRLVLRVEVEAAGQRTDSSGYFSIESHLPPPPPISDHQSPRSDAAASVNFTDINALRNRLSESVTASAQSSKGELSRLVAEVDFQTRLLQLTLITTCGSGTFEDLRRRDGGERFLRALFSDRAWMESFLASDKAIYPATWSDALENLYLLHRYESNWQNPIHQRIATALALQWGHYDREWRYLLVERFRLIKQALADGLLHRSFEELSVREMRWTMLNGGRGSDFRFFLDDRQSRTKDYLGAHGAVRYLSKNVYGVSIHDGEVYTKPWWHAYGTNSLPNHRRVGGVCGALSNYGSAQAAVHGIPSTIIGQPGHCAFVVRVGEEWPVGNSVIWPSDITLRGWDGTNYPTLNRLYEPMHRDHAAYLTATRLRWLAEAQADRARTQVHLLPELTYRLYPARIKPDAPDLANIPADRTGTCHDIDVIAITPFPNRGFTAIWDGELSVSGMGPLQISLSSTGPSRVLIGGRPIATSANRQLQQPIITLSPGRHPLRIEFNQAGGDPRLVFEVKGVLTGGQNGGPDDWVATYEQAITAQPINYVTWIDYLKLLESAPDIRTHTWTDLGQRAARALAAYHEAGWSLVRRCLNNALPQLTPTQRMDVLLACNQDLRQDVWFKPDHFPYDGILNWQADHLGDPKLALAFFGKLLAIHHSEKPENNFILGSILGWGAKRFAGRPELATDYARTMDVFIQSKGKALRRDLLVSTLQSGIRSSGKAGDVAGFRLWSDLAQTMLPPLKPGDVHLTPKQAAEFPTYEPFPGDLVSKDGMLHISSDNPDDRPLSYRQLLSGGFGGWFDTKSDVKPWAQVQLMGECELSGIVLVNRYEYAATHEAFVKSVPFDVLVSADGTAWTKVATFSKPEVVFRVDLQGGKLKARFVRLERLPKPGESGPIERFYLRGFLVYGKRLY